MREEKKGKQTSERRKYRENEQKGRPLAAPQSFEMPVRSAAETASISPSAAAAEKENDPDTAVVAAVAASASTAVMSVSAAAAQEQDDPDHVVAASPHPDAGASHPHPQFVAAKSLMLIPPELSLHFQYMHHGMSDFHSEDEKCCSSFPAEAVAEGKILYGPNVSVLLLLHVV